MTQQSPNQPCRRSQRLMKEQQKGACNIDAMATANLQKQPTSQTAVQGGRKTKTAKKLLKGNSDEDDHVEANVKHNHRSSIPCSKEWKDNHKRESRDQNKADNKRQKMMSPKNANKPDEPTAMASAITINPEMWNTKETCDATVKMDDIHQNNTMANDNPPSSEEDWLNSLMQEIETNVGNMEQTFASFSQNLRSTDELLDTSVKFKELSKELNQEQASFDALLELSLPLENGRSHELKHGDTDAGAEQTPTIMNDDPIHHEEDNNADEGDASIVTAQGKEEKIKIKVTAVKGSDTINKPDNESSDENVNNTSEGGYMS